MIEIIWYREIKEKRWGWEHWYEEMSQYEILYKEWYVKYICKLDNDYGDCCSWRCSATWWKKESIKVSDFWEIHYKPIKKIELESIDDLIIVDEDWGDNYYPSWYASIKEEFLSLFEKTARCKEKRQVYVFAWDSWNGKSYIWRKTWVNVYETDKSEDLPQEIIEEIIVLWNKYNFTVEDIKAKVKDADIIEVNFN